MARQILDPAIPAKENPKEHKDYGTTAGNALSLKTGFGDGEYSVIAEIVDFGEPIGQRIAAIHIQFLAPEDIETAKKQIRNAREKKWKTRSESKKKSIHLKKLPRTGPT